MIEGKLMVGVKGSRERKLSQQKVSHTEPEPEGSSRDRKL